MKKRDKKLQLSREILRSVELNKLGTVAAGDPPDNGTGEAQGVTNHVSCYPGTC